MPNEAQALDAGFTVIDEVFFQRGASGGIGWTRKQLALLGEPWPPLAGWKRRLSGKVIPNDLAAAFVAARKGSNENQLSLF